MSSVIPAVFLAISQFCGAPEKILYSVAMVESNAHPWTLNIEGKGMFFDSRDDMYQVLKVAISEGRSVDIGWMQLNWKWKRAYASSAWELTDPTYNLITACRIIRAHHKKHGDWVAATGYYHREAGRSQDIKARQKYTAKITKAMENIL